MSNEQDNDQAHDKKQADYDDYYKPTVATIMVPVKVRYHDATDVVYGFDPPTMEDVSRAVKNGLEERDLERAKELLKAAQDVSQKLLTIDGEAPCKHGCAICNATKSTLSNGTNLIDRYLHPVGSVLKIWI